MSLFHSTGTLLSEHHHLFKEKRMSISLKAGGVLLVACVMGLPMQAEARGFKMPKGGWGVLREALKPSPIGCSGKNERQVRPGKCERDDHIRDDHFRDRDRNQHETERGERNSRTA